MASEMMDGGLEVVLGFENEAKWHREEKNKTRDPQTIRSPPIQSSKLMPPSLVQRPRAIAKENRTKGASSDHSGKNRHAFTHPSLQAQKDEPHNFLQSHMVVPMLSMSSSSSSSFSKLLNGDSPKLSEEAPKQDVNPPKEAETVKKMETVVESKEVHPPPPAPPLKAKIKMPPLKAHIPPKVTLTENGTGRVRQFKNAQFLSNLPSTPMGGKTVGNTTMAVTDDEVSSLGFDLTFEEASNSLPSAKQEDNEKKSNVDDDQLSLTSLDEILGSKPELDERDEDAATSNMDQKENEYATSEKDSLETENDGVQKKDGEELESIKKDPVQAKETEAKQDERVNAPVESVENTSASPLHVNNDQENEAKSSSTLKKTSPVSSVLLFSTDDSPALAAPSLSPVSTASSVSEEEESAGDRYFVQFQPSPDDGTNEDKYSVGYVEVEDATGEAVSKNAHESKNDAQDKYQPVAEDVNKLPTSTIGEKAIERNVAKLNLNQYKDTQETKEKVNVAHEAQLTKTAEESELLTESENNVVEGKVKKLVSALESKVETQKSEPNKSDETLRAETGASKKLHSTKLIKQPNRKTPTKALTSTDPKQRLKFSPFRREKKATPAPSHKKEFIKENSSSRKLETEKTGMAKSTLKKKPDSKVVSSAKPDSKGTKKNNGPVPETKTKAHHTTSLQQNRRTTLLEQKNHITSSASIGSKPSTIHVKVDSSLKQEVSKNSIKYQRSQTSKKDDSKGTTSKNSGAQKQAPRPSSAKETTSEKKISPKSSKPKKSGGFASRMFSGRNTPQANNYQKEGKKSNKMMTTSKVGKKETALGPASKPNAQKSSKEGSSPLPDHIPKVIQQSPLTANSRHLNTRGNENENFTMKADKETTLAPAVISIERRVSGNPSDENQNSHLIESIKSQKPRQGKLGMDPLTSSRQRARSRGVDP